MRNIAKKRVDFGTVKEILMFENWEQLFDGAVDDMVLVEERDWGMPWPEFGETQNLDQDCNLRIFEYSMLTMPFNKEYSTELARLETLERSRQKVRKLLAARIRYIKLMVRNLFKIKTDKMSRAGYNYYTRLIAMFIGNFGSNSVYPFPIRISILCIAYTFAFIVN